jgi:threonyl-tRNA synthetase
VLDRILWERSGHWEAYRENMFIVEVDEEGAREKRINALKPMNCPCHVQVYNQGLKSYRDLPLRLAEFGSCHRYESSGSMHGLMRVRGFVQDDAHIFCTEDQIERGMPRLHRAPVLGLPRPRLRELRDQVLDRPEVRIGSDEDWDSGRRRLRARDRKDRNAYEIDPGEGAFYGRSSTSGCTDAIGRKWQCGTSRWTQPAHAAGAEYVGEDGPSTGPSCSPRDPGSVRALHRHPDRELRGRPALLARAAAGRSWPPSSRTRTLTSAR